jgi:hypothetical protein
MFGNPGATVVIERTYLKTLQALGHEAWGHMVAGLLRELPLTVSAEILVYTAPDWWAVMPILAGRRVTRRPSAIPPRPRRRAPRPAPSRSRILNPGNRPPHWRPSRPAVSFSRR